MPDTLPKSRLLGSFNFIFTPFASAMKITYETVTCADEIRCARTWTWLLDWELKVSNEWNYFWALNVSNKWNYLWALNVSSEWNYLWALKVSSERNYFLPKLMFMYRRCRWFFIISLYLSNANTSSYKCWGTRVSTRRGHNAKNITASRHRKRKSSTIFLQRIS